MSIHRHPRVNRVAELFRDTESGGMPVLGTPESSESTRQRVVEAEADRLLVSGEREALEDLVVSLMERQNELSISNLELRRDLDEALGAYHACCDFITEHR